MTRLYTRTGDAGETGLLSGQRVSKASARVDAYGSVDELNAFIGAARVEVLEALPPGDAARLAADTLATCQDALMRLAAALASSGGSSVGVGPEDVTEAERRIDEVQAGLADLGRFLMPGVSRAEAALHVARTVCRRAERRVVALAASEGAGEFGVQYLNRLSDLLFALARHCLKAQGLRERVWRDKGTATIFPRRVS